MSRTEEIINFVAVLLIVFVSLAVMVAFCIMLIPLFVCIYALALIGRVLTLFCALIATAIDWLWRKCFHTEETPSWLERFMDKVDPRDDEF